MTDSDRYALALGRIKREFVSGLERLGADTIDRIMEASGISFKERVALRDLACKTDTERGRAWKQEQEQRRKIQETLRKETEG